MPTDDVALARAASFGRKNVTAGEILGVDDVAGPLNHEWQGSISDGDNQEARSGFHIELAEDGRREYDDHVQPSPPSRENFLFDRRFRRMINALERARFGAVLFVGKRLSGPGRTNRSHRACQHVALYARSSRGQNGVLCASARRG